MQTCVCVCVCVCEREFAITQFLLANESFFIHSVSLFDVQKPLQTVYTGNKPY